MSIENALGTIGREKGSLVNKIKRVDQSLTNLEERTNSSIWYFRGEKRLQVYSDIFLIASGIAGIASVEGFSNGNITGGLVTGVGGLIAGSIAVIKRAR